MDAQDQELLRRWLGECQSGQSTVDETMRQIRLFWETLDMTGASQASREIPDSMQQWLEDCQSGRSTVDETMRQIHLFWETGDVLSPRSRTTYERNPAPRQTRTYEQHREPVPERRYGQPRERERSYETSRSSSSARTEDAYVDLDRLHRCGHSEVVFCEGKSVSSVVDIFEQFLLHHQSPMGTRVSQEQADALQQRFPQLDYHPIARTIRIRDDRREQLRGHAVVLAAGTSDKPVAEEACETLRWMDCGVELILDVGVAGPQRLIEQLPRIDNADVIVVVAGMEGALPSVVGGYVKVPVIAVPTSVGYGASLNGIAALLGMLNSCAANVSVVNIDAGFKGGYIAGLIAQGKWR